MMMMMKEQTVCEIQRHHNGVTCRSWIERRRGSRATRNLYSVGKIYIASALLYCRELCACFSGQARDNDLNCVDVPLNPTHSLTHSRYDELSP